jgi:hypothetical protein
VENLKARAKHLLDNFKLTPEMWQAVHDYQNGVCFICGRVNKSGKRLSTDHSHKTGLFRGLLCQQCNRVLGKIEDPRWAWTFIQLARASIYLQHPPAVAALGFEHFGYRGKVGNKAHRKLLKKLFRAINSHT